MHSESTLYHPVFSVWWRLELYNCSIIMTCVWFYTFLHIRLLLFTFKSRFKNCKLMWNYIIILITSNDVRWTFCCVSWELTWNRIIINFALREKLKIYIEFLFHPYIHFSLLICKIFEHFIKMCVCLSVCMCVVCSLRTNIYINYIQY